MWVTTRVLAARNAGDIVTFKLTHDLMLAFLGPDDQPDACGGSVAERDRRAGFGFHAPIERRQTINPPRRKALWLPISCGDLRNGSTIWSVQRIWS